MNAVQRLSERVNPRGKVMIFVAVVFGLRHIFPRVDEFLFHPSWAVENIVVFMALICFCLFGLRPNK